LASLILKLGGYGLVRLIDIFFYNLINSNSYFVIMGIWGAIISAFVCLSQFDLKKIVAYSSVSHMSLIIGSIFRFYVIGKIGRIFIIIGHGFISSRIFLGLGIIYYRIFSRNYFLISRILLTIPSFFLWWFLIISINISLPPFIRFLRELLIFSRYIFFDYLFSIFSFVLIIFTSLYRIMLFIYPTRGIDKTTFFERDLKIRESLVIFAHSFFFVIRVFFYWILF